MKIPTYIEAAAISGSRVKHPWKSEEHYIHDNPTMQKLFFPIAFHGITAIAAGIVEWVLWRFEGLTTTDDAKDSVEAVWAGLVDPLYRVEWKWPESTQTEGPLMRPLAHSCALLNQVFQLAQIRSNGAASKTIYLVYLARHVMPKKEPFENWLKFVLGHLAAVCPREPGNPSGGLVPREILDPNLSLAPSSFPDLIRKFLSTLDPKANPYLRSPDEMIKLGFKGTPYTL